MEPSQTSPDLPPVQPSVSPYLIVEDSRAAIEFYKNAFGAEELGLLETPDGKVMHAAVKINGTTIMMNDDFPEYNDGKSSTPTALGVPRSPFISRCPMWTTGSVAPSTPEPPSRCRWKISSGAIASASSRTRSGTCGHWVSPSRS